MTPSPTASNISLWLMGSRFLTSLSLRRISLTWLVKALRSASVTVWYTAYFIQYNKIFQYTISTTCQYSTHHPPTTTNHNHHHITNPQQSGRHWSALPARVARSILPSYPILTHTYYISNMLNQTQSSQELVKLTLPEILSRQDLDLDGLLNIKDIHNHIKRNLKIFTDYCRKHPSFTQLFIALGLKTPTHPNTTPSNKNSIFIAADILTCDHQSLADLFIISNKKHSKEDEHIISGDEIQEQIQTEICQPEEEEQSNKYQFLQTILDYINSEQLDENCLNYITKALNILIRRKLGQFLQFFAHNQPLLRRLIEISYYPSIAHFLAKLLTDDEDNLPAVALDVKLQIIPFIIQKIHNDISKPQITQILEFVEDVLNSSRYGDMQERSQLQKMSDILVTKKELDFYISNFISALNSQSSSEEHFFGALNSASFLAVVVNRMNMDQQQDFNFTEVAEFKPTLLYEIEELYANFCKLVVSFKRIWQFKTKFQAQFWYSANKVIEPLIIMSKHSRFSSFYSKISKQDRLQALKTLIQVTCEIGIHGILLQNVTNLLQKMLSQEEKLAQGQNSIIFPGDLYAVIAQHSKSFGILVQSLIQETTIKRNKNQNGIYFRKILLLFENYFKNAAVLQRYPETGSLQTIFPSFNKQNCKLFAQKAAILNHPDGKKVKQVSQFEFIHKNNNIIRSNSPELQEQIKPKLQSQVQKKPVQIVFKLEGKLKALKERVKQKQTDKGQSIQVTKTNQEILSPIPPKKVTLQPQSSPAKDQQADNKQCKQKEQKTGLTFFVKHLLIY